MESRRAPRWRAWVPALGSHIPGACDSITPFLGARKPDSEGDGTAQSLQGDMGCVEASVGLSLTWGGSRATDPVAELPLWAEPLAGRSDLEVGPGLGRGSVTRACHSQAGTAP